MKVAFIGDVSFTGIFRDNFLEQINIIDDSIYDILLEHDYCIANLEGPVTSSKNYVKDNGLVVSPKGVVSYLNSKNINVYNCANNHIFDAGEEGFNDTRDEINLNKSIYFGAGDNLKEASIIKYLRAKDGVSIGLIGISHKEGMVAGLNSAGVFYLGRNWSYLRQLIKEARDKADFIILNYHGGEEFTRVPMPSRRKLLRKIANFDVDLIIAHHSHVFQGIEKYNNKYIFYSLGNFIFDIPPYRNKRFNDVSAIVSIEFNKGLEIDYSLIPVIIDLQNGKVRYSCDDQNKLLTDILSLSDFKKYWELWFKDAYEAFFYSDKKHSNNLDMAKSKQKRKNVFHYLSVIISLLRKTNKRELFISGVLYAFYKKIFIKR